MTVTKERLIYTSGTFKLEDDLRACRRITIFVDLLRKPPSAVYQNQRSNPPKNFFGYVSIWTGGYVARVVPLEYESQIVLEYDNLDYQLYKTINCVGALVIDGLVALGAAMTPPAILVPVTPEPASFPGCKYEWLKFKLEHLTRIKVTAVGEETSGCDGVTFTVNTPNIPDDTPPYPSDRPLEDDPARSDPEEGEQPGDSTPASIDDPDLGLVREGFWDIVYTAIGGGTSTYTVAGLSTDTFVLQSPGRDCALSGSSELIRNGTEVVDGAFNCNPIGFVSSIVSTTFH